MKKALSLLLVATICLLSFSSCAEFSKVKVNGTKIDNEVYYYFEDLYDGDKTQINNALSRYMAINTEFSIQSLTLSSVQKSELSKRVTNLWQLYLEVKDLLSLVRGSATLFTKLLVTPQKWLNRFCCS